MDSIYDPDWLDRAMKKADIRTGQLAQVTSVSRSQIQRIRNGMAPRLDTAKALEAGLAQLARTEPTPDRAEAA